MRGATLILNISGADTAAALMHAGLMTAFCTLSALQQL